jgi:hypothetical protein
MHHPVEAMHIRIFGPRERNPLEMEMPLHPSPRLHHTCIELAQQFFILLQVHLLISLSNHSLGALGMINAC